MEAALGRGYLMNEEFGLTDFYSPPSSIVDEEEEKDDDLFYPEEENHEIETDPNIALPSSSIQEIKDSNISTLENHSRKKNISFSFKGWLKPSPLKLMSIEATPPPTPLIPRRLLDPINNTTTAFQNMIINTNLSITPTKSTDVAITSWSLTTPSINPLFPVTKMNPSKPTANLLTPTNMDRYLMEHRHSSDSICKASTSKRW